MQSIDILRLKSSLNKGERWQFQSRSVEAECTKSTYRVYRLESSFGKASVMKLLHSSYIDQ